jgi:hypothetical protein
MHEEGFFSLFHYLIQYLKQQMGVPGSPLFKYSWLECCLVASQNTFSLTIPPFVCFVSHGNENFLAPKAQKKLKSANSYVYRWVSLSTFILKAVEDFYFS